MAEEEVVAAQSPKPSDHKRKLEDLEPELDGPELPTVDLNSDLNTNSISELMKKEEEPVNGGDSDESEAKRLRLDDKPDGLGHQRSAYQRQLNPFQRDMQQRIQPNVIDQQMKQQLFQSRRAIPEASSASLDCTAGNSNGGDWQEEVYQKIKSMKEMYFVELSEMYQEISDKLQQLDSLPQDLMNVKYKMFKSMLERFISFLRLSKREILPVFKDKLTPYEKQIIHVLRSNRPRKPVSSMRPTQGLPPSHRHST